MRSWGHFVGLLSPKFWHIYRREGLMRAVLRGKPMKYGHEKAGWKEVVRLAGKDEFGNRYYEDFDHHSKLHDSRLQHEKVGGVRRLWQMAHHSQASGAWMAGLAGLHVR